MKTLDVLRHEHFDNYGELQKEHAERVWLEKTTHAHAPYYPLSPDTGIATNPYYRHCQVRRVEGKWVLDGKYDDIAEAREAWLGSRVYMKRAGVFPIPAQYTLENFFQRQLDPGEFFRALLGNDFIRAWHLGDDDNRSNFDVYLEVFIKHYGSHPGWRSAERVNAWIGRS